MTTMSRTKKIVAATTLVLAGFGTGAAAMVVTSASADQTSATATDSDHSDGSGETALSGAKLQQVTDAVLAEYPGETIDRAETDHGGVYEAHITTADGDDVTVLVDEDFAITGTDTGGYGAHGDHHGDGGEGGSGETPLTGTTLKQVTDAVLTDYPGATIDRAETDNGGVYEAHISTADGDDLTVLVDQEFTITGTDTGH